MTPQPVSQIINNLPPSEILAAMALLNKRDESKNTYYNPPRYQSQSKRTKKREAEFEKLVKAREETFDSGSSPRATQRRMARSMKERFPELKKKSFSEIVAMMPSDETQV